jgi:hypothetical protein
MPGVFERVLIEGVLLIVVALCIILFVSAMRARSRRAAPPDALPPLNEEQLAHFDELLEQRDAEARRRKSSEP